MILTPPNVESINRMEFYAQTQTLLLISKAQFLWLPVLTGFCSIWVVSLVLIARLKIGAQRLPAVNDWIMSWAGINCLTQLLPVSVVYLHPSLPIVSGAIAILTLGYVLLLTVNQATHSQVSATSSQPVESSPVEGTEVEHRLLEATAVSGDLPEDWLERQVQLRTASLIAVNAVLEFKLTEWEKRYQSWKKRIKLLQHIVQETTDCILVIGTDGKVQFVNHAAEVLFGRSVEELSEFDIGVPLNAGETNEIQILRKTDRGMAFVNVEMRVVPIPVDENSGFLIYLRDITQQKRNVEQLVYAASHDSLTGLPNRPWFMEQLQYAIATSRLNPNYLFAILFLDLDHFKEVNDTLGHGVGDELLVAVAQRLNLCLRPSDKVARLGGDEFAILLDNISSVKDAISIAERIQILLAEPIPTMGQEICTTASIGIFVSSPQEMQEADALLRNADKAMYEAKSMGHGCYKVFNADMQACVLVRLHVGIELRKAIERKELQLHYQPIVELVTRKIVGFEALARWQHPERGLLLPSHFIPLAEETGLIVPLGAWALEEACQQLKNWQTQIPQTIPLMISVNLSSKQLNQPDFLHTVDRILLATGIDAYRLKLEITENAMVENSALTAMLLQELSDRGIQLCLDDFGTGYSSLSYLNRLPINVLKLDCSFVKRLCIDQESREIIRAIATMAQAMNMEIIAEGIETEEQFSQLQEIHCEYGQGNLFAPAMDGQSIYQLLTTHWERWLEFKL